MASTQTPLASKLRRGKTTSKAKYAIMSVMIVLAFIVVLLSGPFLKRGMLSLISNNSSWTCQSIQIHPGTELSADSILALAACANGQRLGEYSTSIIEQRLEMHPWIRDAVVVRHPPDVLEISITERVCIGIVRDTPDLGVSADLYVLPCGGKTWVNKLPWISVSAPYSRQPGALSTKDPLLPVAAELVRIGQISPLLAQNIAELYRVGGEWGTVLMNPVLSVSFSPGIPTENWLALDQLLSDELFQDRLDSNSVVDLRLPGFVSLQLPPPRAEEPKSS